MLFLILLLVHSVRCGPATDNVYKDQFCTDPRTMKPHAAYSEWADAYSCTRHRCQPGGRNLAIYTVGCKRVEAPESAIECEEVVEDTNMQFPYCCTRLRCLVVVRGEVWTRVLGQPWETLPAAPWSHMYKMKKPPPTNEIALPNNPSEGPVYELSKPFHDEEARDKVLRAGKKALNPEQEHHEESPTLRSTQHNNSPDIVIALSTSNDVKPDKKTDSTPRKAKGSDPYLNEEIVEHNEHNEHSEHNEHNEDNDDTQIVTEKIPEQTSEEKFFRNSDSVHPQKNDIPAHEAENKNEDKKPNNLQALVDAIGTRMRDIEHVVQRMSEKVHHAKPGDPDYVGDDKRPHPELETSPNHQDRANDMKPKKPNPDGEHYNRFTSRGSKYLHSKLEGSTDVPVFVEDGQMNGYYSDASNTLLRRSGSDKLPALTYMAPIDNHHKSHNDNYEDVDKKQGVEKKHKKHTHKRKKSKSGRSHKKHKKEEKKKHYLKGSNSGELEKNIVSLEDSSGIINK